MLSQRGLEVTQMKTGSLYIKFMPALISPGKNQGSFEFDSIGEEKGGEILEQILTQWFFTKINEQII